MTQVDAAKDPPRPAPRKRGSNKLPAAFYRRPALDLAKDLLGTILVRRVGKQLSRARIVETEAYVGAHDLACHASRGRTKRTEIMFGPGGHAYVYLIYGIHEMFNIVSGEAGDPQAVLIRAAEPLDAWHADLSGPGKLARALDITRTLNGEDLTGDTLFLEADPSYKPTIVQAVRVGVDYAKEWKDVELRYLDARSLALSKPIPKEVRRLRR